MAVQCVGMQTRDERTVLLHWHPRIPVQEPSALQPQLPAAQTSQAAACCWQQCSGCALNVQTTKALHHVSIRMQWKMLFFEGGSCAQASGHNTQKIITTPETSIFGRYTELVYLGDISGDSSTCSTDQLPVLAAYVP